jgi:hypothetical protein
MNHSWASTWRRTLQWLRTWERLHRRTRDSDEARRSGANNETEIEIARQDGAELRSVYLRLEDGGGIKMDAQDIGPTVTQFWGDADYEYWVHVPRAEVSKLALELLREKGQLDAVPPASASKLAFELLREKFSGRLDAVDAFRDWCVVHGVQHEFDSWV